MKLAQTWTTPGKKDQESRKTTTQEKQQAEEICLGQEIQGEWKP